MRIFQTLIFLFTLFIFRAETSTAQQAPSTAMDQIHELEVVIGNLQLSIDVATADVIKLDVTKFPVGQYFIRVAVRGKKDVTKPISITH